MVNSQLNALFKIEAQSYYICIDLFTENDFYI